MSADLLRRAATKLRDNAGKASKAPWALSEDGLVWPDCMGDPVSGSAEVENAYYIEMMHPPVAVALAGWLDAQAAIEEYGPPRRRQPAALAVARAVLREDQ